MPLARIKMTAERSDNSACLGCVRRRLDCHGKCADYTVETIVGILTATAVVGRRQLAADVYQVEQKRYGTRGAR